jgi:hypothetical protein
VLFAHDTEVALAAAAALVNTEQPEGDELADPPALDAFVDTWGWTGPRRDRGELAEVRALRPRLRRLWQLEEDAFAAEVNAVLREASALPQLVAHDGWGYHLHATAPGATWPSGWPSRRDGLRRRRPAGPAGTAAGVRRRRLRGRPVDLSKNRSRRYCSTTCSNRINVAAFRARRAGS